MINRAGQVVTICMHSIQEHCLQYRQDFGSIKNKDHSATSTQVIDLQGRLQRHTLKALNQPLGACFEKTWSRIFASMITVNTYNSWDYGANQLGLLTVSHTVDYCPPGFHVTGPCSIKLYQPKRQRWFWIDLLTGISICLQTVTQEQTSLATPSTHSSLT